MGEQCLNTGLYSVLELYYSLTYQARVPKSMAERMSKL